MQGNCVQELVNELKMMKQQLDAAEEDKARVIDELREMKRVSNEANMRLSEVLSSQKTQKQQDSSLVSELEQVSILSAKKRDEAWQLELEAVQKQHTLDVEALSQDLIMVKKQLVAAVEATEEARNAANANEMKVKELSDALNLVKEELDDSSEDLEIREKNIESLKLQLERMRLKEAEFEEKEAILEKLRSEFNNAKEVESHTKELLCESQIRVHQVEGEMAKAKEEERKLADLVDCQKKELEEAKNEVISLQKKVLNLEDLVAETRRDVEMTHKDLETAMFDSDTMKEKVETLKSKLHVAKEELVHAKEGQELASSKADRLEEELDKLRQEKTTFRSELKLATEAEEKSRTAMDELAFVVIQVSKENNETKEKLSNTQSELKDAREEVESLKKVLKNTEDMFQGMLDEVKKERDRLKDEAERLKIEADESIWSCNERELGFVNCIKRAEEESNALKREKIKLAESTKAAESIALKTRDENCKLRDILKQAINESTVAKEGAEIARAENTNLKDVLLEKDYILQSLAKENEALRIKEAAAHENIRELKRLLNSSASSTMETKTTEEKQHLGEVLKEVQNSNSVLKEHSYSKKLTEVLSVKLEEVKVPHSNYHKTTMDVEEDPEKEEMLKGSIFDMADSPVAPPNHNNHHKTPPLKTPPSRTPSSTFVDDGEMLTLEDLENLDGSQLDDMDGDRSSQRKKKALLWRFGDLIRKTSFHRREPSIGQVLVSLAS
ncbi:WEB family protein At5g16730, chloroplastic-like isoform X1 [Papaver somniferum]|uniref:WEB family protein At5g16730, chloroplastic-like isoform X1 n=1 Tax=Papaver somniferum TaxID=3469 RepID=UPI000E70526B|nr:WEB family protein At5g16730, chloroplastic-like isoform X1 [Papaver somniferum]